MPRHIDLGCFGNRDPDMPDSVGYAMHVTSLDTAIL